MRVELKIDKNLEEDKIVISTANESEKVKAIVEYISKMDIVVYKDNEKYIVNLNEIESFYTENGRVMVKTANIDYVIRKRIYEIEEMLTSTKFIRISNSEIVNIDKVRKMEYKSGNIILYFKSNNITYVSRRYIKRVKEFIYKEVDL